MALSFKLSRRIARLRAPVFAVLILGLIGCDSTESLDPVSSTAPDALDPIAVADVPLDEADSDLQEADLQAVPLGEPVLASARFAGGIPIGMAAQPLTAFGGRFNGAKLTVAPGQLMRSLASVRSRGGKVVLMFAGNPRHYKSGGHFDLNKWKGRVNRFKGLNFSSYINDGTIIGHYLMDEPNDPRNWSGRPVSPNMVEEMAKHSKQLWPNMPTIVRTAPDYLDHNHRYLDAAWAAYLWRRGNVHEYLRQNVADAQRRGLALVVGLNVLDGGNPTRTPMTAKEVEEWGSAMLDSSYPCAFIMWTHDSRYLGSSGIGNAMEALRRKAENRQSRTCRA